MNFLYFASGRPSVTRLELLTWGLSDRFEGEPACRETTAGPGGKGGCVFGEMAEGQSADFGYLPDRQTWRPMVELGHPAGTPDLWVGMDPSQPPTPEELQRSEAVDGYWTELEGPREKSRWLVPAGRVFPSGSKLPSALAIGPGGKVVSRILPRFAAASRLADQLWDQVRKAHGLLAEAETIADLTPEREFLAAADILGINYRVGVAELGLIGALTTANLTRVLYLFVDMPGFLAEGLKKNVTASSGPPD